MFGHTVIYNFCSYYLQGYREISCGSAIKIAHQSIPDMRLHSHAINYGINQGSSGQQSVTGMMSSNDHNSLWLVLGAAGTVCKTGAKVACGSKIRLSHLQTGLSLHSHEFSSPLSRNQEVSCHGDENRFDLNDNWEVECSESFWERGNWFRLKHDSSGKLLHHTGSHVYSRPIEGQREISAVSYRDHNGTLTIHVAYSNPPL